MSNAGTALDLYGLVDTGADECFVSSDVAQELGLVPTENAHGTVVTAGGETHVWYGRVVLEFDDGAERCTLPLVVGVIHGSWAEPILGHAGFLEHFDATFSYADKELLLVRRTPTSHELTR